MRMRPLSSRTWSRWLSTWWADCINRHLALNCVSALKSRADGELARIASQLGISWREARTLIGRGPDAAKLMSCRMESLDVDPTRVSRIEPEVSEALKANCVRCYSRRRCLADLACGGNNSEWRQYCPEAATLLALSALPWMTRRAERQASAY